VYEAFSRFFVVKGAVAFAVNRWVKVVSVDEDVLGFLFLRVEVVGYGLTALACQRRLCIYAAAGLALTANVE